MDDGVAALMRTHAGAGATAFAFGAVEWFESAMRDGAGRFLAAALLALVGCGPGPGQQPVIAPTDADLVAEGARVYLQACAPCHGRDGKGDGPVAASLTKRPADLTRLAERAGGTFPRDLIAATMSGKHDVAAHGTRDMPIWSQHFEPSGGATAAAGVYAERRVNALTAYLATIQRQDGR